MDIDESGWLVVVVTLVWQSMGVMGVLDACAWPVYCSANIRFKFQDVNVDVQKVGLP